MRIQCLLKHRSMCPSIFNRFSVIQAVKSKGRHFSTFFAHCGLPWVRPWDNRGKCYMDRKRIQLGLPDVPFLPGSPVFSPVCPASRRNLSRDTICPVFSMAGCGLHEITSWNSRKAINVIVMLSNILTKIYIQWVRAESGNLTHLGLMTSAALTLPRPPSRLGRGHPLPIPHPSWSSIDVLVSCIYCLKCRKFSGKLLKLIPPDVG